MENIKKIKIFKDHYLNKTLKIKGWVVNHRQGKEIGFIIINDGISFHELQLIYRGNLWNYSEIKKLLPGSAISVYGKIVVAKNPQEIVEMKVEKIDIIQKTDASYFLQNKKHTLEFLRSNAHLRGRSRYFRAVFNIRNFVISSIHAFFAKRNFNYLQNPIITCNDCEGAGSAFSVNDRLKKDKLFFLKQAKLTVSGQLHAEAFAQIFKNTYTFGPTFRAEKSNTKVHVAEFWMLEPEMAFCDKKDAMNLGKELIKEICEKVYIECQEEIEYLEKFNDLNLKKRIKKLTNLKKYHQISYQDAVVLLQKQGTNDTLKNINFGDDFTKEQEVFLTYLHKQEPLFIIDYPKDLKAFYMKENNDQQTVACFDLLFDTVGEVIGGSQREDNYHKLLWKIEKHKIDLKNINWYLNLRKEGYGGSAGFGFGLDRFLMYITGTKNIRDVIPFPNAFKYLNY